MTAIGTGERQRPEYALGALGIRTQLSGAGLRARMPAVAELAVPGTTLLRISALCAFADMELGLLAAREFMPRVAVTLTLDVHLYQPVVAAGWVHGAARVVRSGRAVVVTEIDYTDDAGHPVGVAHGLFMAAPDPSLRMPPLSWEELIGSMPVGNLTEPLVQLLGCQRRAPGVAVQPVTAEVRNGSGTLNGGLAPIAVEEAALSLLPGRALSSLSLRYLRPVRHGPALARATVHGDVCTIEVHDAGSDVLAIVATGRLHPLPPAAPAQATATGNRS